MIRKRLIQFVALLVLVAPVSSCTSDDIVAIFADLIAMEKVFGPMDNGGTSLLDQIDSNRWDVPIGNLTCWSAPQVDKRVPEPGLDIGAIGLSGKYLGADALAELDSAFPEGQGSLGYTVYGDAGGSFSPGWYLFAWMAMAGDVPIGNDTRYYDYAAVFDMDDNPNNNYVASPSFPDDFFVGTDYWLRLVKSPSNPWSLTATDARDGSLIDLAAEARALVCDNAVVFMIPMGAFPASASYYPPYRMTSFCHPGDFGQTSGDWSGDDWPFRHSPLARLSSDQRLAATPKVDVEISYLGVGSSFLFDEGISLGLSYQFTDDRDTFFGGDSAHSDTVLVDGRLLGGMDGTTIIPAGTLKGNFLPYAQINGQNQDPDGSVFPRLPSEGDFELTDPTNFDLPTNLSTSLLAPVFASNFSETLDWELRAEIVPVATRDLLLSAAQGDSANTVINLSESWLYTRQNGIFQLRNEPGNVSDLESTFQSAVSGIGAQDDLVDVGVTLDITPRIVGTDIHIELVPSTRGLSFLGSSQFDVDTVLSRARIPILERGGKAATIMVQDGNTVILGGIRDIASMNETEGVPFLGDIPLLARAFQNQAKIADSQTLIVFVTCNIVRNE